MIVAIRMLAYGVEADAVDDYVKIGESTAIESLKKFVKSIIDMYSDEYLRPPNEEDVSRLLADGERRMFPRMLGSIDCMHWSWKNCPAQCKGMYCGKEGEATIILEVVASYDLWIWHAFFGLSGSHNDINVLDRSPVFNAIAEGRAAPAKYSINGNEYTMGYYLADGIYPPWSTFVKTISMPKDIKAKNFATAQESVRKDVERAFGVLQSQWAIVRGLEKFWYRDTFEYIMMACVILHNMIVEDENYVSDKNFRYDTLESSPSIELIEGKTMELMEFIQFHHQLRNRDAHAQLQRDLIEHLWQLEGARKRN